MQQTIGRSIRMNRVKGRVRAWFSKPANVILLIFLCSVQPAWANTEEGVVR